MTNGTNKSSLGRLAEDRALVYLQQQGLVCVTRNYACRYGEIDLVMSDGPLLVFVEVRMRRIRIMVEPLPASMPRNSDDSGVLPSTI